MMAAGRWGVCMCCHGVFCSKQKTAYERRISDWSSDVCSSDLRWRHGDAAAGDRAALRRGPGADIDHMRGAGCVEMSRFECHARGAKQGGARKARGDGGERPEGQSLADGCLYFARHDRQRSMAEDARKRAIPP